MVSAVPAGDVIAREEVFGIQTPWAATIATTIGVVRFPGSPPTQCLSTTTSRSQPSCSPTATMLRVIPTTSSRLIPADVQAVRRAAISTSA